MKSFVYKAECFDSLAMAKCIEDCGYTDEQIAAMAWDRDRLCFQDIERVYIEDERDDFAKADELPYQVHVKGRGGRYDCSVMLLSIPLCELLGVTQVRVRAD
jgi:hypothetical protein